MYDLVIKNVQVVQPGQSGTFPADIALMNGKIVRVEAGISGE